ncbi:DNA repair protein XRCC1 [Latimeria chalumnae]|uniref:DNA repair protein XRCC1 n=1 Tax=Latimeria chalumnae TaxID=7897 RepID=UPI0006D94159|nr:PREDICTED: DNA repair protein XRCC1 [Latimeria chalumnae]|eukprot:XP_014352737.1 PREDICTED: DNA repair protein XRCC1 [Latimeria chalumnae]
MPEIRVKHVVSCSSEDSVHKAENLLKADTYRKWKAGKPGEKQVSIILQLEKAEQIHSIDIGNESSAFVEVLVSTSTSVSEQDYQVLVVTSSFMSPTESRNATNLNRVRMFGPDKLVKAAAERKWDRVKIICTQPYNKNLAYGLSFIRFSSPPEDNEVSPVTSSLKLTKLGQFKVKEEEPGSSAMRPGSLFFSRGTKSLVSPSKAPPMQDDKPAPSFAVATLHSAGDAALDTSPTPAEKATTAVSSSAASPKESTLGKKRFEFPKEKQSGPPAKKPASRGESSESPRPKASPSERSSHKATKAESSAPAPAPAARSMERQQQKKEVTKVKKKKKKKKKQKEESSSVEFGRLLEGTVFVLSGFQNPFRGELRDKALAMGAKYRPDWTHDCTHLICAFANTPKYSQVKSLGGTIVRKEWVLNCHKRKERISCKRYLLDGVESSSKEESESEEETAGDGASEPRCASEHTKRSSPSNSNHAAKGNSPKREASRQTTKEEEEERPGTSKTEWRSWQQQEEEDYGGLTDEDPPGEERQHGNDSEGDTEDELIRAQEENRRKQGSKTTTGAEDDPYGGSTDENTEGEEVDLPIPELPEFFAGKHFLLYGEFPNNEKRLLTRYIVAFHGVLEEYMNESVNYIVTAQEWDDKFEEALTENSNLSFVKPRWIYMCNEKQKLVPHQPFMVVPLA